MFRIRRGWLLPARRCPRFSRTLIQLPVESVDCAEGGEVWWLAPGGGVQGCALRLVQASAEGVHVRAHSSGRRHPVGGRCFQGTEERGVGGATHTGRRQTWARKASPSLLHAGMTNSMLRVSVAALVVCVALSVCAVLVSRRRRRVALAVACDTTGAPAARRGAAWTRVVAGRDASEALGLGRALNVAFPEGNAVYLVCSIGPTGAHPQILRVKGPSPTGFAYLALTAYAGPASDAVPASLSDANGALWGGRVPRCDGLLGQGTIDAVLTLPADGGQVVLRWYLPVRGDAAQWGFLPNVERQGAGTLLGGTLEDANRATVPGGYGTLQQARLSVRRIRQSLPAPHAPQLRLQALGSRLSGLFPNADGAYAATLLPHGTAQVRVTLSSDFRLGPGLRNLSIMLVDLESTATLACLTLVGGEYVAGTKATRIQALAPGTYVVDAPTGSSAGALILREVSVGNYGRLYALSNQVDTSAPYACEGVELVAVGAHGH